MSKFFLESALIALILGLGSPFNLNAYAQITEIHHLVEIESHSHFDSETMFIFDIDNTLITPDGFVGTDGWYDSLCKKETDPVTGLINYQRVNELWTLAQPNIQYSPTESSVSDWLEKLRAGGNRLLAMTARDFTTSEITLNQLHKAGIHWRDEEPDRWFMKKDYPSLSGMDVLLSQGILYVDINDKGVALEVYFRTLNRFPKKLIFVDDNLKNVQSIEKLCTRLQIECDNFRYDRSISLK